MNTTQIKYFLTAARTLNFTEAAKQLYISQPALSKQISAIEKELNMMLFIRTKHKVRLTPAALVLLEELSDVEEHYESVIRKARIANEGNAGSLSIGILEGQMVGEEFANHFADFSKTYPNIDVRLVRDSFSGLRKQLEEETIDIAITLEFDLINTNGIQMETIATCPALAAVSVDHPLSNTNPSDFSELKGQTFIAVDKKDCYLSDQMIIDDCKRAGFLPDIIYAPSLETAMLWIEAGMGVGFINTMNNLTNNPRICIFDKLPTKNTFSVMAWKQSRINPTTALFTNFILDKKR